MENTTKAAAGLQAKLATVKANVKLGKDAYNSFAKFNYRNAETMLAQINPALAAVGATIDFSDDVVMIGDRYYIKTTLTAHDTETGESYAVTAFAREQAKRTGMDDAQVTGSSMTYAHKYALMSMFAVADPKADPDAQDNRHSGQQQQQQAPAYQEQAAPAAGYYGQQQQQAYYDYAPSSYYAQQQG